MNDTIQKTYDGIDLEHPWVLMHRIPLAGLYPDRSYFVSLEVPSEDDPSNLWNAMVPTEAEATILGAYIEYVIDSYGYGEQYLNTVVRPHPLDSAPGINTRSFIKQVNGTWHYRMFTWRSGPSIFPGISNPLGLTYPNLVDLLDKVETFADTVHPRWVEFKDSRPDIFGEVR